MKDPPPQKAGNSRDGGSIETAEGMEVSHAMWKVKQAATAGQDAAATVAPPDAIAQARAWEEGKHDVPIDIGSDSDEEGPAPLQKPAKARVHVEYASLDIVRRIFHETELDLARDAQQGMDDLHGRRGPKRRSVDLSAVLKKGRGRDPIVLHGLPVETSPSGRCVGRWSATPGCSKGCTPPYVFTL